MTRGVLDSEDVARPAGPGAVFGIALGVVSAFVLSWLSEWATRVFVDAAGDGDNISLALAGLLLLTMGVVLGIIGFAGRYHPLVPGVPAIWFVILLGPSLIGLGGPPSWLPDFVSQLFLRLAGPAVYVMFGYLVLATGVALFRRRRKWIFR